MPMVMQMLDTFFVFHLDPPLPSFDSSRDQIGDPLSSFFFLSLAILPWQILKQNFDWQNTRRVTFNCLKM